MEEAHIVYDPKQVRLPEMEKIIQDLGYRVPKEEVDMEITGMTCEFSAVDTGKAPAGGQNSEQAYLNQLYDAFGADKVIVQE